MVQSELLTIDEFYKFASKIAKRDKWFIGGFLGAVYEEWKEKHSCGAVFLNVNKPCTREKGHSGPHRITSK